MLIYYMKTVVWVIRRAKPIGVRRTLDAAVYRFIAEETFLHRFQNWHDVGLVYITEVMILVWSKTRICNQQSNQLTISSWPVLG